MTVTKMVYLEKEVEVQISAEDVLNAISESTDRLGTVLQGINNCARFLKAVPDDVISDMNAAQKKTIAEFLQQQTDRFKPLFPQV